MDSSGFSDKVGAHRIYRSALVAVGDYLEEEDIAISRVMSITSVLVHRISRIYTTLAQRTDEPQKGELVTVAQRMNELVDHLMQDIAQDEEE